MRRREFLRAAGIAAATWGLRRQAMAAQKRPNVVFVFADQWRAQATGYAGDPNVKTPNLDRLAAQSLNFRNAVSGCPVCTPYRGTLLTGQYPLTTGLFVNDVCLKPKGTTLAEAFKAAGYATAYIGKWHIDGHGRSTYIPPERRHGFDTFKALECTHNYNRSAYYEGDSPVKRFWEGYDAIAQTRDAIGYLRSRKKAQPFLLMLSWGGPHDPYFTAPTRYRAMYPEESIKLRPNVPEAQAAEARRTLAGYYAHCTALDDCLGELMKALDEEGLAEETIFVFTSDHGDMLQSQGEHHKQRPWDESIRVPFLARYPKRFGKNAKTLDGVIETADIMPTLLGLSGIAIPESVEGRDFSTYMDGKAEDPSRGAAVIACYHPFGQWTRKTGGREYRGLRTTRYTYVRTLDGPWLLYDNERDPHQKENLAGKPEAAAIQRELDAELTRRLKARKDDFLPGMEYIKRWGYAVDASGTVPYAN